VEARPTTSIGEVRLTGAPSVFLELGYHDNPEDASWVKNNLDTIARNLVRSLCEFFSIPFLTPVPERQGTVTVNRGSLNIRARPDTLSPILAQAYNGARITIINEWKDWYLIRFGYIIGYVRSDFVSTGQSS
jgi:N-acetylmuramoyl-L-alanine amidase